MKDTRILMGMPVTVEIVDKSTTADLEKVFDYFKYVDAKFSTYKPDSEISEINDGRMTLKDASDDMRQVFDLSEQTKNETKGFFDIKTPKGDYDPSGLVKGWAINNAADLLLKDGFKNFYVEAGGDVQTSGFCYQEITSPDAERGAAISDKNEIASSAFAKASADKSAALLAISSRKSRPWSVGIKNPFNQSESVKVVYLTGQGMATSGTYIRGQHIYNPHDPKKTITDILSLTVIGPNVYESDRFATAAFAMGKKGIGFIEDSPELEGYMIDKDGIATMTSGLKNYLKNTPVRISRPRNSYR